MILVDKLTIDRLQTNDRRKQKTNIFLFYKLSNVEETRHYTVEKVAVTLFPKRFIDSSEIVQRIYVEHINVIL